MRVFAELSAMDPRFKLAYLVPHVPQDLSEASPFGWYTPGLHEAAVPLQLASTLPADIREPYTSAAVVLLNRQLRLITPLITPIQLDAVARMSASLQTPFQVYLSTEGEVADQIDAIATEFEFPILHLSAVPGPGRVSFADATPARIGLHVRSVLDRISTMPDWRGFVLEARGALKGSKLRRPLRHPLPKGEHNVTRPNELALMAFGRSLPASAPIVARGRRNPLSAETYVARICASADAVGAERARLLVEAFGENPPVDYRYVIATASAYWGFFQNWRTQVRAAPTDQRKVLARVLSSIVQGQSYFDTGPFEPADFVPGSTFMSLSGVRARDAASFTAALALLGTTSLTPILRLEPRVNAARGQVKLLAHCVRSSGRRHYRWKESRLARELGIKLRSLVDPKFLERIDAMEGNNRIEGLKLVTDLPLEPLPTNIVPLGLRFDVSRDLPVPGNLYLQQCTSPPVRIPLKAFEEILVIRSFKPNDRLRTLLETAVRTIQASKAADDFKTRYRFVDVQNTEEFVAALQDFEGAVLIFDGHGAYSEEYGIGSLVVGDQILDAWELGRRRIKVPPIVMFSACDTLPMDGSHSSVAMAVFNLGAKAVLATNLPIDGVAAAVFNARLALRIEQFMPIALKTLRPIPLTWRLVVSGMLRMSHTGEILTRLQLPGMLGLSDEQVARVQLASNIAINSQRADWYQVFEAELAESTGATLQRVRHVIASNIGLTDAMKYVHLGSPEDIVIIEEMPFEELERLVAAG